MRIAPALCILAVTLASDAAAQTTPAELTGTWTGMIGRRLASLNAVEANLRFDERGTVTGVITGPDLNPGDIRNGVYDAATGAVKFEVVVRDDARSVAKLDGFIVGGTAIGRIQFGGDTGVFRFARSAGGGAQTQVTWAGAGDAPAAVKKSFGEVSRWVSASAALVPADKYSYRPVGTVRTFAQLVGHVADSYLYYCARGTGRQVQWSDAIEKGSAEKGALVERLASATDACVKAAEQGGEIGALVDNIAHTNLHYGNMITYLRMLGLTPPSS